MDKEVSRSYLKSLTTEERAALSKLKEDLERRFKERLVKLVVFGSKARDDFDEDSDLDIAIIIHSLTRREKNEILQVVAEIELENLTPLSTLVLSEDEFVQLRNRERRIAMDIETEGIPL